MTPRPDQARRRWRVLDGPLSIAVLIWLALNWTDTP